MGVSPSAAPAFAEDKRFSVRYVFDNRAAGRVPHQRAARDANQQIRAFLPGFPPALSVRAVGGGILAFIAEIHQRGEALVRL